MHKYQLKLRRFNKKTKKEDSILFGKENNSLKTIKDCYLDASKSLEFISKSSGDMRWVYIGGSLLHDYGMDRQRCSSENVFTYEAENYSYKIEINCEV